MARPGLAYHHQLPKYPYHCHYLLLRTTFTCIESNRIDSTRLDTRVTDDSNSYYFFAGNKRGDTLSVSFSFLFSYIPSGLSLHCIACRVPGAGGIGGNGGMGRANLLCFCLVIFLFFLPSSLMWLQLRF